MRFYLFSASRMLHNVQQFIRKIRRRVVWFSSEPQYYAGSINSRFPESLPAGLTFPQGFAMIVSEALFT